MAYNDIYYFTAITERTDVSKHNNLHNCTKVNVKLIFRVVITHVKRPKCILILFAFNIASQLFGNWGCKMYFDQVKIKL